jgi:hypothetical protein
MVLKPASGKKCGHAAKNYSNNKDCKIRTPAHDCIDPCPKGTDLSWKLFISYAHLPAHVNGSAWSSDRLTKLYNPSQKHNQLAQKNFSAQTQ